MVVVVVVVVVSSQNRATKGITERYHHHPIFLCQKCFIKKMSRLLYYLDYEAFDI